MDFHEKLLIIINVLSIESWIGGILIMREDGWTALGGFLVFPLMFSSFLSSVLSCDFSSALSSVLSSIDHV